jgi:DNA polymerase III subunit alpha
MTSPDFVHLHVHSSFSLLESALTIQQLAKLAEEDHQPALALTDSNNLFGALEFSEKMAGLGIQPIAGLQLSVQFEVPDPLIRLTQGALPATIPSIVLLAQSEEGYRHLMQLASEAFFQGEAGGAPFVAASFLQDHAAGLIALTGGSAGPLNNALEQRAELVQPRLHLLQKAFGNRLYVELQRHGLDNEKAIEAELIALADHHGLPLVATNQPFFAKVKDYEAHDALLAIADGRVIADPNRKRVTPEHHFKTRAAMAKLFADLPDALAASVEIAQRCAYRVRTRKPILPRFTHINATDQLDEAEELQRQAEEGLAARLAAHGLAPQLTAQDYQARLAFEVSVIARMQYPGYFLIVADFIQWAKKQGIPVGPGRGSGAGSLVAYALTITDLDPLRFGLLFERFLNPDRVSMPDFDIDFCQEGRERVIDYVMQRYGEEQVAQIITFGTLQARGVLRDVGRVLEMPYGQVDKLTKLVPINPANPVNLKQAIEGEPRLQSAATEEPVVARLLTMAQKLEGLHRHASTHAAGLVIGDRPLQELVPLYRDPKAGTRVTQYNMKWVEQAGLVKFDFLGLKTLTVLRQAVDLLKARGITLSLDNLPLDDAKTFQHLGRGETVGVFQLESAGMRKALIEMVADRFEDIIALVALYRPGPMANIPVYCARKLGKDESDPASWYVHEKLEPILKETFGIIVYQEQVMQVAQILSGYSLGEADLLRRAMGKKIKSEMDAQRDRFVQGAIERGLPKGKANEIFDLLAKFADYGFNKSHAAAYALIAYQTAYLKANHPVEFLAASMTLDMDNTDKLSEFRRDAQRLGILVDPPSINRSGVTFGVRDGTIIYALSAIKGVGTQAVEAIIAVRGDVPFKNPTDFAQRLQSRFVNKRTLENLIAAGAFDDMEADRAKMHALIDAMLNLSQRAAEESQGGMSDMFSNDMEASVLRVPAHKPWSAAERLQKEFDATGFYLSGHPLDQYESVLDMIRVQLWADFVRGVKKGDTMGRLAAAVLERQERRTKSGSKMGIVALSDQSGQYEAILFSEGLLRFRDVLEPGRIVILTLQANVEGEEVRARIANVESIDDVTARHHKNMRLFIQDEQALPLIAEHLKRGGEGEVSFILQCHGSGDDSGNEREIEIKLPGSYQLNHRMIEIFQTTPFISRAEMV